MQGRVYAFLGENDDDDTHITLNDVCSHHGVNLADFKGKARIASRAGFDNLLMHFMNGKGIHTELFNALQQEVVAFDADSSLLRPQPTFLVAMKIYAVKYASLSQDVVTDWQLRRMPRLFFAPTQASLVLNLAKAVPAAQHGTTQHGHVYICIA